MSERMKNIIYKIFKEGKLYAKIFHIFRFSFFALSFFHFFIFSFFTFSHTLKAEKVVWYNVENVFDTKHDSLKNDFDFLPDGSYRWTPWRYWKKLDNIARLIAAVAEQDGWPMLVGMCEVENDTVLRDLTLRSPLRAAKYQYVHHEGPDLRGVDVCLLYQPEHFHLLGSEAIRVPSVEQGLRPTRDILHAWGRVPRTDSMLHVFVLHFPSRAGGNKASTQNRMLAAQTLCEALDKLQGQCVLVMGDFNAEPKDPIFQPILQRLVSLVPQRRKELKKAQGSYYYQGLWGYIDHMLISPSLQSVCETYVHVAKFPFLLTEKGTPWRTFQGPVYKGGYSDHLPLYINVW